jgi:hypothetical protein
MKKEWVIVKFDNDKRIEIWRDYGTAWGSALYEVLDYFTGSYLDAKRYSKTLISKEVLI